MALTIDVFTAQSVLCEPVVKAVQDTACPNCEVTVYDMRAGHSSREGAEKVAQYGITRLPAVAINGELADCCSNQRAITRDSLLASVRRLSSR